MAHTPAQSINESETWMEVVRRKVAAIRFGSVQVTVHEGQVTLVDALERTRIAPGNTKPSDHERAKRKPPSLEAR